MYLNIYVSLAKLLFPLPVPVKYAAFHRDNFARLKACATSGQWTRPAGAIPLTIHL